MLQRPNIGISLKQTKESVDARPMAMKRCAARSHEHIPRLAGPAGIALTALLAMCLLLIGGSSAAIAAAGSCSSLAPWRAGCMGTLSFEQADAAEEEAEEELEEGEEAASAEARAEELDSGTAGQPSNPISGPSEASSPSSRARTGGSGAVVSRLELTTRASTALEQRQPPASTVGFSFMLSAPTIVKVTLVRQLSANGKKQWVPLPDSLTVKAARGRVNLSLTGHNRLSHGRYRLTVKPAGGDSRSIYLSARR
jgi:hypothetical protein